MNRPILPLQSTALPRREPLRYRHRPCHLSRGLRILVVRKHPRITLSPTTFEHELRLPADMKKKKKRKREDDSDVEGAA